MLLNYRLRSIAIAVGLVAAAAVLIGVYLTSYRNNVESGSKTVPVLVAARDIPEGTSAAAVASGKYLKTEHVLRRSVMPGAITKPEQLSNVVAAQTIYSGSQVSERAFRPATQIGVLAKISGNVRAMLVPGTAEQLLDGMAKAGDHVDVVANVEYKVQSAERAGSGDRNRVASRVILRNLLVLRAPEQAEDAQMQTQRAIGLALSDSQAQKLFFAMQNGTWSLALRPTDKPVDSPESVETIESVLADGLKFQQLTQLTGGYGKDAINGR